MPVITELPGRTVDSVAQLIDSRADRPPLFGNPGQMFFRLEEPNLGVLDLTCDNGYVITQYDLGYPNVRPVVYDIANDNGTYDITRYFGARTVTLDIALRATVDVEGKQPMGVSEPELRDRLLAYLQPGRRPTLVFQEHTDSRVRTMMLRAESASLAVSQPQFNKLSVSWVAPRGVIHSYGKNCVNWTFDASNVDPLNFALTNAGNMPAHWTAQLNGAVYYPKFTLHPGTSRARSIQLEYVSAGGDAVIIDSFTRRVSINGVETGYKYVDVASKDWFLIPPGQSNLLIETGLGVTPGGAPAVWNVPDPGTAPPPGTRPPDSRWWKEGTKPVPIWSSGVVADQDTAATIQFCVDDVWI